ncbi:hypothetical protein SUGI_1200690 [Cryptomeria japonica]|nr:hypothetical protein SUGI_1200690 [Cryptomeria japonica]
MDGTMRPPFARLQTIAEAMQAMRRSESIQDFREGHSTPSHASLPIPRLAKDLYVESNGRSFAEAQL